jgi:hypothetical protein
VPTNNRITLAEDGGEQLTGEQRLSGSAVPSTENQTRRTHCHQGHGRQARTIGYRILRYGVKYVDRGVEFYEAQHRRRQIKNLRSTAAKLGFRLVEAQAA